MVIIRSASFRCFSISSRPLSSFHRTALVVIVTLALATWGRPSSAYAQVGVTGITAAYTNVNDTSGDYAANGAPGGTFSTATTYNMAFNVGTQNNLVITAFSTLLNTFLFASIADQININRVDNATVTGTRHMVWYETESFADPDFDLAPSAVTTQEQALLSQTVNRGTDNAFQNQGNGDSNNNNIERIDFVFTGGLSAPLADLVNVGFLVLERGGNDAYRAAAITAIDGSGNPTAFGTVLIVSSALWGSTSFNFPTTVMRKDPADADLRPSTNVNTQTLHGIYMSLDALGVLADQTIYGYALFPPDAGSDLVGLTDFPTNTGSTGGLDLVAGGIVYTEEGLLPVELTGFGAAADGQAVLLSWQTASETNNAGFEIQRRPAEAEEAAVWEALAFVAGAGTTLEAQAYRYRIDDLAPGSYRFRLKQIDFDGTFAYSSEVEIHLGMPEQFVFEPVFPNPFNPQAQFRFGVRKSQPVQAVLYDALGRQVAVLYDGLATAGQMHTVRIDGHPLPSGVYLVRIAGETFSQTQPVTLIR